MLTGGGIGESQTNSLIILVNILVIVGGMSCTHARYWVMPPGPICTIWRLPSMVGLHCFHRARKVLTLSRVGVQMATSSIRFPIQAPRTLVGSPSFAIRTVVGMGVSSRPDGSMRLVSATRHLYAGVPTGMISVFPH